MYKWTVRSRGEERRRHVPQYLSGRSLQLPQCPNLQQRSERGTTDGAVVGLVTQTIGAHLAEAQMPTWED